MTTRIARQVVSRHGARALPTVTRIVRQVTRMVREANLRAGGAHAAGLLRRPYRGRSRPGLARGRGLRGRGGGLGPRVRPGVVTLQVGDPALNVGCGGRTTSYPRGQGN
ncbi:hypothetical protein [Archangium sp.]|uniref:hypothetical protein n=1 Tax=Archangium sp. TaxID=1872627 RepID=UPI002D32C1DD|nr:hypothetical protein [Archangium sp.]HYO51801.1 hypothetical protein [Archangium sp.]